MDGRLVPTLGGIMTVQFAHRVLVAVVFLLVLYTAIRLRTMAGRIPVLTWLAWALVALFAAQIVVGALNVWTSLAAPAVVSHVALSTLIWCVVVAAAAARARPAGVASERGRERAAAIGDGQRRSLRETTVAYVRLTKPCVWEEADRLAREFYREAPFVRLRPQQQWPKVREVEGTNYCDLAFSVDQDRRMMVVVAVIDNLTKGAAGQAVQNLNLMAGWPETAGLS
jgi:hypothetical protein